MKLEHLLCPKVGGGTNPLVPPPPTFEVGRHVPPPPAPPPSPTPLIMESAFIFSDSEEV